MIELLQQLLALEHGVLEFVAEADGIVRTSIHAQFAEHARAQVVLIVNQYFSFLAVFAFHHLGSHLDGAVGAGHLAQTAGNAAVLVVLVVRHDQRATVALRDVQGGVAVFRILLRDILAEVYTDGGAHTDQQGLES